MGGTAKSKVLETDYETEAKVIYYQKSFKKWSFSFTEE